MQAGTYLSCLLAVTTTKEYCQFTRCALVVDFHGLPFFLSTQTCIHRVAAVFSGLRFPPCRRLVLFRVWNERHFHHHMMTWSDFLCRLPLLLYSRSKYLLTLGADCGSIAVPILLRSLGRPENLLPPPQTTQDIFQLLQYPLRAYFNSFHNTRCPLMHYSASPLRGVTFFLSTLSLTNIFWCLFRSPHPILVTEIAVKFQ